MRSVLRRVVRSLAAGTALATRLVDTHALDQSVPYTIEKISERRVSEEGQQGMGAFLRKEKAPWAKG